jgi:hypothetical protein
MAVTNKGFLEAAHRMAYAMVRTGMQAWTGTQVGVSVTPVVSVGQRLQASQGSEVIITMVSHVADKNMSHVRHTFNFIAHHFSKNYITSTSMADHTFEYVIDEAGTLPSPNSGIPYQTNVGSMFMYYTDEDDYSSQVEFSITILDA